MSEDMPKVGETIIYNDFGVNRVLTVTTWKDIKSSGVIIFNAPTMSDETLCAQDNDGRFWSLEGIDNHITKVGT